MYDEAEYKRIGMRKAIFCVSLGLFIAFVITLLLGVIIFIKFPIPVSIAMVSAFLSAYFYGNLAGKLTYRVSLQGSKIYLIGIALAFACVITITICSSSYYFFKK